MNKRLLLVPVACIAAAMVGCKKEAASDKGKPAGNASKDGHDHADHDHDDHGHDHAKATSLGKVVAGTHTVEASLESEVKAGAEAHVQIEVTGEGDKIVAVRAWIGVEDGAGSTKAKGEKEEHGFHIHVEAPDPMPAGSKLWAELENEKGETKKVSFDLKS